MNQTTKFNVDISDKILLDTDELQSILSCGRASAVKIGKDAGAKVQMGRRVLWNQERIKRYVNNLD